ncbi:MAG: peptidoglycan-associated lipoprotein Pal [Gammaproteobacteria bacterium]|jgi:peptidoglycan-associated lipoprotein|nr:MAG: peptidoglycan-associated lipoprotein Pal [Gammaproteobacteria bacterium]
MNKTLTQTLIASTVCLLAACSTTGNVEPAGAKPVVAVDATRPTAEASTGLSAADLAALRDPANPLSKRSIYFDLDSNVIKQDYASVVETHGKFLAKRPGVKIMIRGNADERGSAEYNLALGQRRADSTKQGLVAYGVREDQIETVSFGSEKPVAQGHTESAWAKNRRADIAYPGE